MFSEANRQYLTMAQWIVQDLKMVLIEDIIGRKTLIQGKLSNYFRGCDIVTKFMTGNEKH